MLSIFRSSLYLEKGDEKTSSSLLKKYALKTFTHNNEAQATIISRFYFNQIMKVNENNNNNGRERLLLFIKDAFGNSLSEDFQERVALELVHGDNDNEIKKNKNGNETDNINNDNDNNEMNHINDNTYNKKNNKNNVKNNEIVNSNNSKNNSLSTIFTNRAFSWISKQYLSLLSHKTNDTNSTKSSNNNTMGHILKYSILICLLYIIGVEIALRSNR